MGWRLHAQLHMHAHTRMGMERMGTLAHFLHLCTQVWRQEDHEFEFESSLG